jgi:hypothetical protein
MTTFRGLAHPFTAQTTSRGAPSSSLRPLEGQGGGVHCVTERREHGAPGLCEAAPPFAVFEGWAPRTAGMTYRRRVALPPKIVRFPDCTSIPERIPLDGPWPLTCTLDPEFIVSCQPQAAS